MKFILFVGYIFWFIIALLGARKILVDSVKPFSDFISRYARDYRNLFVIAAITFPIVGIIFVVLEVTSIGEFAGVIGEYFSYSILFAVLGALSISALIWGN